MEKHIKLPLTAELAKTLHAGDTVYLTGTIYTSRDAGHKRMCEALAKGEKLPFDPTDATIYYVGPTPAKPGQVIGSAGPTTSGRMDAYAPTMMSVGARGMIGKGARLPEVVEAMKKYSGVYFGAIGGAGALLAKCIKSAELIAYEDLGAEALRKLYVEEMPLVVIIDSEGNVISNTEPVVKRQVVSKEVSEEMALILEQVVGGGGSGKQAAIPGYRVGGKTGTSEQLDDRKEDGRIPNTLSFFGFAPVDDPQVACLVLLDDPDIYNAFGSTVAAPIVGSILAETLPYMGIEPQYTEEELENIATQAPYLLNYDLHEAEYEVRRRGLKFRVIGNGAKVLKQVPGAGELIPQDGVIVLYTEEEGAGELIPVPDVVGKTLQEANQSIVGSGLQISVQGEQIEGTHSVVSAQSPDAGEMVEAGTVVTVECVAAEPPAQP